MYIGILNPAFCIFVADSFPQLVACLFTLLVVPSIFKCLLFSDFQNASLNCQPKVRRASPVFSVTQTRILRILDLTAQLPLRSRKLQSVDQNHLLKVGIYNFILLVLLYQHPETFWFSETCYFCCCLNQNLMRKFLVQCLEHSGCSVIYTL